MGIGDFLVMLLSFTGAAVTVIWTIVLAVGRVKRMAGTSGEGQLTPEEVDAIRAWLAEQEHADIRVEQIEERLDFVERVLGRSREAQQQLGSPTDKP
jgi:hypothetical protein